MWLFHCTYRSAATFLRQYCKVRTAPGTGLLLQSKQPGMEADMSSKPIFIRDTYKGSGKLAGKVAIITGGRQQQGLSPAESAHCHSCSWFVTCLR